MAAPPLSPSPWRHLMSVKCIETAHSSRFTIPTARREPEGADRPLRGGGGWNDASDEALSTRTETHGESCQASVTTVTRPGPSEVTFLAGPGLQAEDGGWTFILATNRCGRRQVLVKSQLRLGRYWSNSNRLIAAQQGASEWDMTQVVLVMQSACVCESPH